MALANHRSLHRPPNIVPVMTPAPQPNARISSRLLAAGLLTVTLTLLAYLPAIGGGFIWDDDDYVTDNQTLRTPAGLLAIWTDPSATPQYYPLVHTSFWVEYQLWQLNPLGYHLDNVLIHLAVSLLLWRLLHRLSVPGAWLAATIFAVHPVHVESVAWITERKNVLSAMFALGSILCYLRINDFTRQDDQVSPAPLPPPRPASGRGGRGVRGSRAPDVTPSSVDIPSPPDRLSPKRGEEQEEGFLGRHLIRRRRLSSVLPGEPPRINEPQWRWYAASILLFIAALLSKTVAATLPAALLVMIWWKTGGIQKRTLIRLIPFFVIGIAMGLMTVWLEKSQVGAEGVDWQLSPIERCLIAGRAICFYASKLVFPVPLIFNYPRWNVTDDAAWQYAYPAAVLAVLVGLFLLRHRIGRGPVAAVALFCGLLFPALGFFDVYPFRFSFVADHFQYHAAAALIAGVTAAASSRARTDPADRFLPRWWMIRTLPAIYLVFLAILTFNQGYIYEGLEPLWRDTLQKNPDSFLARTNLAAILNRRGEPAEAEALLRRAIEIKPDFPDTHVNLAKALELQGRTEEAEISYRRATEIEPRLSAGWNGLAAMLGTRGDFVGAEAAFRRAEQLAPTDPKVPRNLATLYTATGQPDLAADAYRRVLDLDPASAAAHRGLAELAAGRGDLDAALDHLKIANRLEPNDVQTLFGLGAILSMQQRWSQAVNHYRRVVELDPTAAQARQNLAAAIEARDAVNSSGGDRLPGLTTPMPPPTQSR